VQTLLSFLFFFFPCFFFFDFVFVCVFFSFLAPAPGLPLSPPLLQVSFWGNRVKESNTKTPLPTFFSFFFMIYFFFFFIT